jgi:hypothetical protein
VILGQEKEDPQQQNFKDARYLPNEGKDYYRRNPLQNKKNKPLSPKKSHFLKNSENGGITIIE